jgi:hypothetical protein
MIDITKRCCRRQTPFLRMVFLHKVWIFTGYFTTTEFTCMSQGLSHVKPRSGVETPRSMRETITSSKALRLVDLMTTNLVVSWIVARRRLLQFFKAHQRSCLVSASWLVGIDAMVVKVDWTIMYSDDCERERVMSRQACRDGITED